MDENFFNVVLDAEVDYVRFESKREVYINWKNGSVSLLKKRGDVWEFCSPNDDNPLGRNGSE